MNSQENNCLGFLQASMLFYLNIIRRLNTHEALHLVYTAVRNVKCLASRHILQALRRCTAQAPQC